MCSSPCSRPAILCVPWCSMSTVLHVPKCSRYTIICVPPCSRFTVLHVLHYVKYAFCSTTFLIFHPGCAQTCPTTNVLGSPQCSRPTFLCAPPCYDIPQNSSSNALHVLSCDLHQTSFVLDSVLDLPFFHHVPYLPSWICSALFYI